MMDCMEVISAEQFSAAVVQIICVTIITLTVLDLFLHRDFGLIGVFWRFFRRKLSARRRARNSAKSIQSGDSLWDAYFELDQIASDLEASAAEARAAANRAYSDWQIDGLGS